MASRAVRVAILVVAALVAVAAVAGAMAAARYDRYLTGLWAGDPAFLEKAKLRDFQLFLAPAEGGRRRGYLIQVDPAGAFLANQTLELREPPSFRRWASGLRAAFKTGHDSRVTPSAEFSFHCDGGDGGAAKGPPPFPPRVRMAVSILDSTLTLYDGEKVYAFLEKDAAASAAAVAAYSAPPAGTAAAGRQVKPGRGVA